MTVSFFDSNPGIVNELRVMDHNTKEYKKLLQKVFMEIGGITYLFNFLKDTDEGNRYSKKYFFNLILAGAILLSMFIWIFVTVLITGGKELNQFNSTDIKFFIGFIFIEIASFTLAMVFALRCKNMLLQGVSFLIDNYKNDRNSESINTLSNYKFERSKVNKIVIIVSTIFFVVFFGIISFLNGTSNLLIASKPQSFSKSGFTITLTQEFHEKDIVSLTATFSSSKFIVMGLKDDFKTLKDNGFSTDISLKEYANNIIKNSLVETKVEGTESRPNFVYKKNVSGKDYTYLAMVFRGSDAYWIITFACETKNYESSKAQFEKWADSVKVE